MIGADPVPETLADRAATIFRAIRSGETDRMDEFVSLLTPIMWHTARAQRLDQQSAEDVLQTTWLALVRTIDGIADPQSVLQWLIVATRRESWRVLRTESRADATDIQPDDAVEPTPGPELRAVLADADQRLWRHVATLPERCRVLLRVVAFADRPDYASVARSLGMPVGSIGPTRGRCLAKLRARLDADPGWQAT